MRWFNKIGLGMMCIVICMLTNYDIEAYGYIDSNLYEEKLVFLEDGTLVMTTHDKKATTNIKYQTIGWVIKRYDMPKDAVGQQYVIIPAQEKVEYRDDPNDTAYVYCYYYGNKERISNSIYNKSAEWKNLLYKYGDYVYIDEIMTVVESGVICGGLNSNGTAYGEVYFDYDGISNARDWAAKENLKTHFDKNVYFPQQITEKKFGYEYSVLAKVNRSHSPIYQLQLGEGTKYQSTYDVLEGVPTGKSLYINGYADNISYNISFIKANVNLRIPIKLVIRYTLKWKAYDGSVKTEIKDVISWYYVNRRATYYMIEEMDIDYLSEVIVNNYAFESGSIVKEITGCKPKIIKYHTSEYYNHIISPVYKDVYYIDGGEITQMVQNGIKPTVPDINRQSVVESFVGECEAVNDSLSINGIVVLDNEPVEKEAKEPLKTEFSSTKGIYYSGFTIPHTKMNKIENKSTGYLTYKDLYTGKSVIYNFNKLKSISIHTPVCISAKEIRMNEREFKIDVDIKGKHRDIKGYGYNDYSDMCEKIYIKFSEDILINGEQNYKDVWVEWDIEDVYSVGEDIKDESILACVAVKSKNSISVDENLDKYLQEDANLDISKYGAYTNVLISIEEISKEDDSEGKKESDDDEEEDETTKEEENKVVGTH